MAHLGDASLEFDSDCDFLMDCDEGLREVLHLLCATLYSMTLLCSTLYTQ